MKIRRRTTGFAFGWVTDTHIGQAMKPEYVRAGLDWIRSRAGSQLVALLHSGDMTVQPAMEGNDWRSWIHSAEGGAWPPDVPVWPCVGNHDAEVGWMDDGVVPQGPHATMIAHFGDSFAGREWWSKDVLVNGEPSTVRVIAINNLSDYFSTMNQYYNCNPPGDRDGPDPNSDHSGITVDGSPQRLWLNEVTASDHLWKIVLCHRGLVLPFDSDPRRLNRVAWQAMKTPIDNGVSLFLQGDVHVGSLSGPWYPSPLSPDDSAFATYVAPGGVGAWSMSLAGSYAVRQVNTGVLADHASTCHWAEGGTTQSHLIQAAVLFVAGDDIIVEIWHMSDTIPAGIAMTKRLRRNGG